MSAMCLKMMKGMFCSGCRGAESEKCEFRLMPRGAEIARDTKRIEADVVIAEEASTSAQLETVAQTMRVEATQSGWAGKWRPFWGFVSAGAFGISVLGIIGWVAYALVTRQLDLLKVVPELIFALTTLFSVPGAILGVASWHRGVEKRIMAGEKAQPA